MKTSLTKLDENDQRVVSSRPPALTQPDFDPDIAATAQAAELRRDGSTIRLAISSNQFMGSLVPLGFLPVDALILATMRVNGTGD
jgi:hypothetical protein